MPILACAPISFGLTPDEVEWINDGDYSGLYPDDAAAIRQQRLPKLHHGALFRGMGEDPGSGANASPAGSCERRNNDIPGILDSPAASDTAAKSMPNRPWQDL